MNKKIKCILIDLDGTIINSGPDLIDSLNFVLRNQNIKPIERSTIGSLVGGGALNDCANVYYRRVMVTNLM